MSQKTIKAARRAAEKTTKSMAFELAKMQITEIANAPFKIKWQFCKAILFPKKLKRGKDELRKIKKAARGAMKKNTGRL